MCIISNTQEFEATLRRVKTGNVHLAPAGFSRDLSLLPPEYWATRPYPKKIWHWTEEEFAAFLEQYRFPPNTLRDRENSRLLAIRSALVRGEVIPQEVMADRSTEGATADAAMEISASFAASVKHKEQHLGVLAFEKAIGYLYSDDEFRLRLGALLMQAAEDKGRKPQGRGLTQILSDIKKVGLDGLPFNLTVSLRTTDEYSHSKAKWLEIRDARYNDVSLYGDVWRITFDQAEVIFRRLLTENLVTIDAARSVMGSEWQPYTVISTLSSWTPAP